MKRGKGSGKRNDQQNHCDSIELLVKKCKNLEQELLVEKHKNLFLQSDLTAYRELLAKQEAKIARLKLLAKGAIKSGEEKKDEEEEEEEMLIEQRFVRDILPLAVWGLIFNELESSEDLKRCCRVSKIWKEMLEPQKAEWMMDEVFGLIVSLLPKREILGYRMVCRRWCRAVDEYLTNGQYDKKEYERKMAKWLVAYQLPRIFFQTDFGPWMGSEEPMIKFMQEMQNHYKNPFIGRSLRVCVRHGSQVFLEFIRKFGHFLESLEIYFEFTERGAHPSTHTLPRVKYICACLEQVQNLSRLVLFFSIYKGPRGIPGKLPHPIPYQCADENEVKEYFNTQVAPIPSGIKKFGFVVDNYYDGGVFQAAIRQRVRIPKIDFGSVGCLNAPQYDKTEDYLLRTFRVAGY